MSEEKQIGQTKKCPKCQEEVLKGAKKCKHCGSDLRNWFMRHKITTIFLFFMVIGIISAGNDSKNLNSNQNSNTPQQASNNNQNNAVSNNPATKQQQIYKIGDNVSTGYFGYMLQKVEQKSSVGSEYINSKAGGIYEICYLSLINRDKDPRYADSSMFKIVDDQNRSFAVSTDATTTYTMTYGNQYDLFLKQANPGVQVNGILVFDIPKDAKGLKLEVSGGMISAEKEYIQIN